MLVLDRPDRNCFERHSAGLTRPVLLRGLTDAWPARAKWTIDYLRHAFGEVRVNTFRGGAYDVAEFTTLADYLVRLHAPQQDDPAYLSHWAFEGPCPALLGDYASPPLFERLERRLPAQLRPPWRWIFIGPAGSGSALHVDVLQSSAWNAAISGRKRWLF